MKLITFCVPSYNSQDYMSNCIDSLLEGGEDVEILIIDDGSKDNTAKIADEYQAKYPTIVRAIHKPNGGHGSGVNRGLAEAKSLYYKVVDSDDHVKKETYLRLLDTIRKHLAEGTPADCYFLNFVYDKPALNSQFERDYSKQFPSYRFFSWNEVHQFDVDMVLLMHALVYKTDCLRASKIQLPEHTFYVDDIFAYQPLPYMKKLYYIPEPFYMYFIGRDDQSVTMKNIIARYEQQIRVMKCMLDAHSYHQIKKMDKGLKKYMFHALENIMMVTLFFTCGEDTPERKQATKDLWKYIKHNDRRMFYKLRYRSSVSLVNYLPFKLKGKVMTKSYLHLVKKENLG